MRPRQPYCRIRPTSSTPSASPGPRSESTPHPHRNEAQRPKCHTSSSRVHSRYRRRPADTALGARPVVLELTVRRFFCINTHCTTTTFAEQIPESTTRCARRTTVLDAIGLALAGRAGARQARDRGRPRHPAAGGACDTGDRSRRHRRTAGTPLRLRGRVRGRLRRRRVSRHRRRVCRSPNCVGTGRPV
ncbi:transposase family protein [Rhodococcus zopfii]|uniref:transposase family protein n=1 Tax=Rhodococcus zopfii TaxID=43772 RepID=UPI000934F790|nr:transposase family protein [Rhodococcus zopfii]